MHFGIIGDIDGRSRVGEIIYAISGPTRKHFDAKDYGPGLKGIGVVLMCHDASLSLRRRVRHSKKEKKLYADVMLDFSQVSTSSSDARRKLVLRELELQLGTVLERKKIPDFAHARFISDLKAWLSDSPS